MKRALTILFASVCVIAMAAGVQAQAESKPEQKSIKIYPPHSAPKDMTMMEEALHRRATEVVVVSTL